MLPAGGGGTGFGAGVACLLIVPLIAEQRIGAGVGWSATRHGGYVHAVDGCCPALKIAMWAVFTMPMWWCVKAPQRWWLRGFGGGAACGCG